MQKRSLEECLEIRVITYNRCEFLLATLDMLASSPFRGCRITVIDNCSSDRTGDLAPAMSGRFASFTYLRNRINIGGNPNYLKAIEASFSEYTWILCDDDLLDFSDCDDVIEAVTSGNFELVEVGAIDRDSWPREVATSVRKLIGKRVTYHYPMSFFPAYIFRTALFDSPCFCWGYKHIDLLYPQFEFLNKSVRDDFSIYIPRKRIVTRNDVNELSFSPLFWYACWVACCRTIPDRAQREREIANATLDRGFFKSMTFWTIMDKHAGDGDFWFRVLVILRTFNWIQRLKYLMVLPLVLLPLPFSFWVWVRSTLYRLMKVPESDVPPVQVVTRG